jgi:hypothetical protein
MLARCALNGYSVVEVDDPTSKMPCVSTHSARARVLGVFRREVVDSGDGGASVVSVVRSVVVVVVNVGGEVAEFAPGCWCRRARR